MNFSTLHKTVSLAAICIASVSLLSCEEAKELIEFDAEEKVKETVENIDIVGEVKQLPEKGDQLLEEAKKKIDLVPELPTLDDLNPFSESEKEGEK